MDQCWRQNAVVPLFCFIAVNLLLLTMQSDGRYLRPSDHGLAYQARSTDPTKGGAPEMLSFFNGGNKVSLPEAKNLTGGGGAGGDWWKNRERRMSRDAQRSHVRKILVVASLVCGLTGVVLLVASAFLFLFRNRQRKQQHRQPRQLLGAEWSKHKSSSSTHESTSTFDD